MECGAEALMVGSGVVWWAEDDGEVEAGEFGMDGSAGAIGGVVSAAFASSSACLHVPADDAGIGRWLCLFTTSFSGLCQYH